MAVNSEDRGAVMSRNFRLTYPSGVTGPGTGAKFWPGQRGQQDGPTGGPHLYRRHVALRHGLSPYARNEQLIASCRAEEVMLNYIIEAVEAGIAAVYRDFEHREPLSGTLGDGRSGAVQRPGLNERRIESSARSAIMNGPMPTVKRDSADNFAPNGLTYPQPEGVKHGRLFMYRVGYRQQPDRDAVKKGPGRVSSPLRHRSMPKYVQGGVSAIRKRLPEPCPTAPGPALALASSRSAPPPDPAPLSLPPLLPGNGAGL